MNTEEIEREVRGLIARATRRDAGGLEREADLVLELGLDSLAGLRVLAAVEKRFGLRIPDGELGRVRTLAQILELVERENGGTS
jgi:acyl carrier protein